MRTRLLSSSPRPALFSAVTRFQRSRRVFFRFELICAVCCIASVIAGVSQAAADTAQEIGTTGILQQIEQARQQQQDAERRLALKQGAVKVAEQRVRELQAQLDEATKRVEAETAEVSRIQQDTEKVTEQLANLTNLLQQHQAADALQTQADEAVARLEAIQTAKRQLESQLAALRKSSVEHQSQAVESEQKVQTLESTRAELQKAVTETKTAMDAAQAQSTAADAALATTKETLTNVSNERTLEQQRLDSATVASAKLTESIDGLQKSLDSLTESAKVMGANPEEALKGLAAAIADLKPLSKNASTLVEQLTTRRDAMTAKVEQSTAELKVKETEQSAMLQALQKATEAHQQAEQRIAELNQQQEMLRKMIVNAQTHQKMLNAQTQALDPSLQKLAAEIQLIRTETVARQKLAEAAMEPLGRFVSFSRHVAPIFAKRCVACHNTRSPGGRLNLDTFAALNKGGESGAAYESHKSQDSLLLMMIEDGSMPKDAEPLSPEEVELVRQWIDVGAPLDAGLLATAELFDVIPEAAQPLPPASYRVPIPVTATAFSPDGSLLATSGYHEVLVWKTDDGSMVRRISNVAERVYDLEFSQDGQLLAVAAGTPGQLGEVKLFSPADGSLTRTLVRARDAIFAVSFSPDGTQLASAGADRSIVVARIADGQILRRIEDHADWVMDINWSPDGKRLVSSGRDKTSKVFDSATGDPQITFSGHGEPVYSAAFLNDSKTVVSAGGDKRLRIWNSADAKEVRAITGFGSDVFRIVVAEGDRILSASADRNVREHTAADGKLVRTLSGHSDWVYTLAFSPVRNLIVTGSYDGEIRVWNSQDGSMQTSFIAIPKEASADSATASTK